MLMPQTLRLSVVTIVSLLLLPLADAARLYRYLNEDGNIVLDSRIPKEFVRNGYDILDDKGRVIKHIPRALTESEIAEKDRLAALALAAQEAQAAALQRDKALLRQYTVVQDVERARDRKVKALEGLVQSANSSVQRLLTEKQLQQSRAAKLERRGAEVPNSIVNVIASIDKQIALFENKIITRHQEQQDIKARYAYDISRMKELLGIVDDEQPSPSNEN